MKSIMTGSSSRLPRKWPFRKMGLKDEEGGVEPVVEGEAGQRGAVAKVEGPEVEDGQWGVVAKVEGPGTVLPPSAGTLSVPGRGAVSSMKCWMILSERARHSSGGHAAEAAVLNPFLPSLPWSLLPTFGRGSKGPM